MSAEGQKPESHRDEGVRVIIGAMCDGTWQVGKSHRELGERYSVTEDTVRGWASEASRFLRMCRGNEDEIRTQIIMGIQACGARCLGRKRAFITGAGELREADDPDLRTFLGTLELLARVHGLLDRKTKNEVPTEEAELDEIADLMRANGFVVEKKQSAVC